MRLPAGHGWATLLPAMDFETYSAAGYEWNGKRWQKLAGASKYGLQATGVAVYAEHPSTEVLSLAYNLQDGRGPRMWLPGMPPPPDLLNHFERGLLMSAWNDGFEFHIWRDVCHARMGWPMINPRQLRDDAAKARAWGLPGGLGNAAKVLNTTTQKGEYDKLLWKPRQPTKGDLRTRLTPQDEPENYAGMLVYNEDDVEAETQSAARIPDLEGDELEFALLTAQMNYRGMAIDLEGVKACIGLLEECYADANAKLSEVTNGAVESATQNKRMRDWLATQGVHTKSLDADHREELLARPWPPGSKAHEALKLYDLVTGAGPRKVYTMLRMANKAGRLCNLYIYHGARTGRDAGQDVQPQNLVKAGHPLKKCTQKCHPDTSHLTPEHTWCPNCKSELAPADWHWSAAEETLDTIKAGRGREVFASPVLAVSGCIRSLFTAAPGHDLICSDYSSVEAVVTACLAGEQWRIDAFHRGDDIYLTSAGRIKNRTLEWYAQNGGKSHPDRQKIGKPAELGLGFGGWIGAWRQFDDSDTYSDEEVKDIIKAWRKASPAIVEFWGGQCRGKPWAPTRWERFGLEGAAINAVQFPGMEFKVGLITYFVKDDVLYCKLPSGRHLAYHRPRLGPSDRWAGHLALSFEGWNSNSQKGQRVGWVRMDLYGGLLCENVVQATARDLLRGGVIALEKAGYPIVLRVHDEVAAEVPEGTGSVEEFERLMATIPPWAEGWPIKASGGWRGKRFRKD